MKPPVEAPTSRQIRCAGIVAEMVEGGRELDAAARHPGVGRGRRDVGVALDDLGGLGDAAPRRGDEAGGDRFLRLGTAGEEAARDEQEVDASRRRQALRLCLTLFSWPSVSSTFLTMPLASSPAWA